MSALKLPSEFPYTEKNEKRRIRVLLRRVIAHFREREWTAISMDFLIVAVGVCVGIKV